MQVFPNRDAALQIVNRARGTRRHWKVHPNPYGSGYIIVKLQVLTRANKFLPIASAGHPKKPSKAL